MTGSAIRDSLDAAVRAFTSSMSYDSTKSWFSSIMVKTGLRLKNSKGSLTSTSPFVTTWYPSTTGGTIGSALGGFGVSTLGLELIYGTNTLSGWFIARDSSGLLARFRTSPDVGAWEGGAGEEHRMIPDRSYGGFYLTNKVDANGNLVFNGGQSGATKTAPHGLLNVYRSGIKNTNGTLNYSNSDDIYAIKSEHFVENLSATSVTAGAIQGWTYLSDAAVAKTPLGVSGGVWSTSTANINRALGLSANITLNNALGIIDSSILLKGYTYFGLSGGTITRSYGVFIYPLVGTNKWSFYGAGTGDSLVNEGPARFAKVIYPDASVQTTAYPGPSALTVYLSTLGDMDTAAIQTNDVPLWDGDSWIVGPMTGTSGVDTASVMGLIIDSTVQIQTSSGYRPVDSSGVIVNAGEELLAQVTLDSSIIMANDTTTMGHTNKAVTVTHIVLIATGTVSLTPRFIYNDSMTTSSTAIITSPAAFTTARSFVTLATLNNVAVPAGNGFWILFDSVTTRPRRFTAYIYGHRTF
jgi:hypothetical protein